MAYTITNTPRKVDFGKNPIGFKITRNRFYRPRMQMGINSALPIGSTVTFYFSDKAVTFTVVASADNSGTQLTSTTNLATLLTDLNKNTVLFNNWNIQRGTDTPIFFFERDTLDYFDIEVVAPDGYLALTYFDRKFEDPQRMVSELFLKQNGYSEFVSQGLSFHAIDLNGKAYINLMEKVLRGFSPYNANYKHPAIAEIINPTYYLKVWEYKETSGTVFQELSTTDIYTALYAQLGVKDFSTFAFNTPFHILSNAPAWQEIWSDAHNELTVLITSVILSFNVKVKLYFTDETDTTITFASNVTCSQYKAFYIPAGVDQLGIITNTPSGKTCYRYEVIIESGTDIVSKSFIIKDKPDFGRVFRFINAMGGFDCFFTLGYIADKRNVDVETNERSLAPFYLETTKLLSDKYNTRDEFEMKIKSLTTAEAIHFKEIVDSPFVYLEQNGAWVPIVITSKSFDGPDEEEDLHDAKINFRYA